MEASSIAHSHVGRRGIFARCSPLLKLQSDEALVALTRRGNEHAFGALVERYRSRLLGFCRQMLGSTEDAEDVLQESFVAAYNAMVADQRPIAVRPWLYRICRNRCLNYLRKPAPIGEDTMDVHVHDNGTSTYDRVQRREEFRHLIEDVGDLPETQRAALVLREMEAMSYEEIAHSMDTTVPSVKSLLVRARIGLAQSSQARALSCDEVRLQLAEAVEGLAKVGGAARRHLRGCRSCQDFRSQLRSNSRALAAIFPLGPLALLKDALLAKLGLGAGSGGGAGSGAAGAAGAGASGSAAGGTAAAGAAAAGSSGAVGAAGAAIGTKAVAGLATAALLTAGAVEVNEVTTGDWTPSPPPAATVLGKPAPRHAVANPHKRAERRRGGAARPEAEKVVKPVPVVPEEEGTTAGAEEQSEPLANTNSAGGHSGGTVMTTGGGSASTGGTSGGSGSGSTSTSTPTPTPAEDTSGGATEGGAAGGQQAGAESEAVAHAGEAVPEAARAALP